MISFIQCLGFYLGFFILFFFFNQSVSGRNKRIQNTATVMFKTLIRFASRARNRRRANKTSHIPRFKLHSLEFILFKVDFGRSDTDSTNNCCWMPSLYFTTIAKTQDIQTRSPAKSGKPENTALTFSRSSLSCWLCCHRSGAAAPPECRGYPHLSPARKKKEKAKNLKSDSFWFLQRRFLGVGI